MLVNLTPLYRYRDFRLLVIGQTVSYLGSMITYVAMPWQIYELTHSSLQVGLLGTVQLLPVLIFGLLGGSVADSMDRRKLILGSEILLAMASLTIAVNATLKTPSIALIYIVAGIMQAANGFHRPAMDAMVQQIVSAEDYASVSVIGNLRSSVGAIVGPALGGILIAAAGVAAAYAVDLATFVIAVVCVVMMKETPKPNRKSSHVAGIVEGVRYAARNPVLLGTYLVDIVAMTFAFPIALFPAMGEAWGGAKSTGVLFSAMSAGSLVVTVFSGWTNHVRRHGLLVLSAAALWGLAVIGLGFSRRFEFALVCLALAGAADTVSGIFRQVIWNETVPNHMRGRLSGIEMISYMSGPLLGNARAGWVASLTSLSFSVISGGATCLSAVILLGFFLPHFWNYRSNRPQSVRS